MTISWFERSSGMIFEMIISAVRSPIFGFAPPRAGGGAPPPFFSDLLHLEDLAQLLRHLRRGRCCVRLMIQTFSPAPG